MNAISAAYENLDWECSKHEDVEPWSFDSEKTIEYLDLQVVADVYKQISEFIKET